ncbi:hypothetical protein [Pontibacter indicus]|uniref:Uncharacterized protein n=1 Tax=Pontibacter indicus TaxID=1317125 RepID=A0A1R3WZP4_9BACT|nr:hypothetical protein [Pontibacter indicus]SIT83769.1 hypothetical protein SAMN05444128_1310 [Pontibacter indicus]
MDKLRLEIEKREDGSLSNKVVIPFINEKSLIEILKGIELEYDKSLAGAYDGISPAEFIDEFQQREEKVKSRILECECGCDGCWSFVVKITEKDDLIEWSHFEQVHRDNWEYTQIEPFQFERSDYLKEMEKLKA